MRGRDDKYSEKKLANFPKKEKKNIQIQSQHHHIHLHNGITASITTYVTNQITHRAHKTHSRKNINLCFSGHSSYNKPIVNFI